MQARSAVRAIALARAAFGAVLTVRTTSLLRMLVRNAEPTGSLFLFARTVGIRDLVLGVGTLLASFDDENGDGLRRWAEISLASDAMDTAAGMLSARHVGVVGSIQATTASIPFVAGGWWALRHLTHSEQPTS